MGKREHHNIKTTASNGPPPPHIARTIPEDNGEWGRRFDTPQPATTGVPRVANV
jgi:hypothetical protein